MGNGYSLNQWIFEWYWSIIIILSSLVTILSGNVGVSKTYIAEVSDSTNQARAFGLTGLMWGIGGICE